ncbi:type III restriction-modification system endonuclease [Fructilactobacillus cliffordii]|uniref:Type III restriction-modification system endonuclease n=1 Tax=Fructilactobacillus cliffordii TaxID=2940299 RepID=A0A9Q8ZVP7_9LACO|nr:type III restriction-modification system endonuclease [Fructilactobacillus cliffordii]USS89381.1 type III restriction-modification system endonuclease [Fructilactobacillus cliffordii]
MKIKLETLQHQLDALSAIDKAFPGIDNTSNDPDADYIYANSLIKDRYNDKANIDIKMETGTGKTYVYTRMMYELHQKYGLFKFVIVVPSPSIKEGTRSFITSDYAKQHFSEFYENTRVQLNVINAGDFSSRSRRKGRKNFPAQLTEFVESTRQNTNQIEVLLTNQSMLNSTSMKSDDYDQTLLGGETSPIKSIAATRPIVIIDEPQKFPRNKKFYRDIEAIKPQLIVRFGATFPEITICKGKNKVTKIDYYRGEPQFNLDAVDSFNQGLVKGVDIDYPDISEEQASNLYKVKQVKPKELILTKNGKDYQINVGENLADVDSNFEGNITYDGGTERKLSNELLLAKDMKLIPGTFSVNYQDEIISQALDRHFEAEQENFLRSNSNKNVPKIKTLSLFFIDSISSFRSDNGKKGWLADHFESLLLEKLNKLINKYSKLNGKREKEYYDFLQATIHSLKSEHQKVYAGYFSKDRGSSDKYIQAEVEDILNNKEKLLSFKDKNGNWITRRFLFSMWTLREGWDNPNVFVIAKLRTSGSDINKIQEVGRGLRLPVDENGHRLKQDEWPSRLSFLIGYDERDFAQKLVGEINEDSPIKLNHDKLTEEMINLIVKNQQKTNPEFTSDQLVNNLGELKIIDFSHNFKNDVQIDDKTISGFDALCQLYPEIKNQTTVANDRVRDKNSTSLTKVKLRKDNWKQLQELWGQLSKRQMIKFNSDVNQKAEIIAQKIFDQQNIFVLQQHQIIHNELKVSDGQAFTNETQSDDNNNYLTMKYGKFLKSLTKQTGLSVNLLNNLMIEKIKSLSNDDRYINEKTLANLVRTFNRQFNQEIINSYKYEELNFTASTSIYNAKKQQFIDSISANDLGVYQSDSNSDETYLYERPPLRYDSAEPELEILKRSYDDKVKVFGKLPKRSIKIPRFDNGTTSPDFIFKIENEDGPVYLIIETKAENMRVGDEVIKTVQEKYFNRLKESGVYYQMATSEQQVHDLIKKLEDNDKIN